MKPLYGTALAVLIAASSLMAADAGVTLIGVGAIAGDSLDLSGLDGDICQRDDSKNCIPRATLGGLGSGISYTGHDDVYLAVPDRGPFDGRTTPGNPYVNRVHFLHMTIELGVPYPNIRTRLLDTRILRSENRRLLGDAYSFNTENPQAALRLDPEAVAVGRDKTFFISDEYGPYVYEFDREGYVIRRLPVPSKFLIAKPGGDIDSAGNSLEIYPNNNTSGRQANRGMEGLAITPNGRFLVGIMQSALIQDNGLDTSTPPARVGLNNRIVRFNLQTGQTQEYVYVMDSAAQGRGVNEILAINDHEFLVLERDNRTFIPTPPAAAAEPLLKRIYKIDLNKTGLTDVSIFASLPLNGTGLAAAGVVPVDKVLFLDLLDPAYKIDATRTLKNVVPEKIEGLAWGPELEDGRQVLYVTSDNDLNQVLPTRIYAFAIHGPTAKISYQPQELPKRLFPKGKVKKALGK